MTALAATGIAGCLGGSPDEEASTGGSTGGDAGSAGTAGGGSGASATGGSSGAGGGCKVGATLECSEDETGKAITFPGAAPKGECKKGVKTCEMVNGVTKYGACKGAVAPGKRDCASPKDADCDGAPDNQVDSTCQCLPTDDKKCTGPAPGNCPGTRECGYLGSSSKWGTCTAPADCSCTADQPCKMGQCSGMQKCTAGKLGKCMGSGPNPVELLSTCECDPGLGGKACTSVGGSKSCGTASCGSSQKYDLAACTAPTTCYVDADKDGAGAGTPTSSTCSTCPSGTVSNGSDCDDTAAAIQTDGQACVVGTCAGKATCSGGTSTCKVNGCTANASCTLCSGPESGVRVCGDGCLLGECSGSVSRSLTFSISTTCGGATNYDTGVEITNASGGCETVWGTTPLPKGTLDFALTITPQYDGLFNGVTMDWGVRDASTGAVLCTWTSSWNNGATSTVSKTCPIATPCKTYSTFAKVVSGTKKFYGMKWTVTGLGSMP